jgi:predicted TIM-barrel fold metal-dependent hydrolase
MRIKPILTGFSVVFIAASAASAQGGGGGTPPLANGQCPAGMTEVRPGRCQAPLLPPPSILDYRPRSTLVVPKHMVPKAKFPVIDFHGHISQLLTSQHGMDSLVKSIDGINVRLVVAADDNSGAQLKSLASAVNANAKLKNRVAFLAGVNFNGAGGPGWAEKAVAQLRADVANGAVGIGEIGKELGLTDKKADGSRLRIDDPALDPVWQEAARLGIPVFIHTADPQEFFRDTIDYNNERWLELALFPGRRWPPSKYPTFDELMTERDNMFRRNPKTTFVAAHMGWYANNLGKLGTLLDEMPNVYTEMGAVLYDVGRQPRTAHDFFIKYQDRILFGKDSFQPEEYPYYWRVFETADDYFDYYRNYHAFWKLYGIDLPDAVLKKVYFANALKITKGLDQTGWPR